MLWSAACWWKYADSEPGLASFWLACMDTARLDLCINSSLYYQLRFAMLEVLEFFFNGALGEIIKKIKIFKS